MKAKTKISEKKLFVLSLNNKRFIDLSENFQSFIKYIDKDVKDEDVIYCKEYGGKKIDYIITIKNVNKNISFKSGKISCIHRERIQDFVIYLKSINVSQETILSILKYHYADGTFDGSGIEKCYGELLKKEYKEQIDIVNKEFENKELLSKVIDYVLISEKRGKKVDYFYHGDCRKGVFASSKSVKDKMLSEKNNYPHDFMRIGVMNFMPLQRNHCYSENAEHQRSEYILKLNIKKYI